MAYPFLSKVTLFWANKSNETRLDYPAPRYGAFEISDSLSLVVGIKRIVCSNDFNNLKSQTRRLDSKYLTYGALFGKSGDYKDYNPRLAVYVMNIF